MSYLIKKWVSTPSVMFPICCIIYAFETPSTSSLSSLSCLQLAFISLTDPLDLTRGSLRAGAGLLCPFVCRTVCYSSQLPGENSKVKFPLTKTIPHPDPSLPPSLPPLWDVHSRELHIHCLIATGLLHVCLELPAPRHAVVSYYVICSVLH